MPRLEQIAYDAGRHALADQEALVAGIRKRAGTLLAAHALVASFLGAGALRDAGVSPLVWLALAALAAGLVVAVLLLLPWQMRFSIGAYEVHGVAAEVLSDDCDDLDWLLEIAWTYERVRQHNTKLVDWMTRLSGIFALLVVVHAALWIAVLMGVE